LISFLYLYPGAALALSAAIYASGEGVSDAVRPSALAAMGLFSAVVLLWQKSRLTTALAFLPGVFYILVVAVFSGPASVPIVSVALSLVLLIVLFFKERPRRGSNYSLKR